MKSNSTVKSVYHMIKVACILSAILLSMLPTGCKPKEMTANLQKMDTLQQLADELDATLILDEDVVAHRLDSMNIKLSTILKQYPDSGNMEIKNALTRYAGIANNYKLFLDDYPIMEFDADKRSREVKEMKERLTSNAYGQREFEQAYEKQKRRMEELLDRAKKVTYNTYSVENDYRRMSEKINPLYNSIIKHR